MTLNVVYRTKGLKRKGSGMICRWIVHVGRYSVKFCNVVSQIRECNKTIVDSWHIKLGHASVDSLSHIPNIILDCNSLHCEICPVAKQCRLPFNRSSISTYNRL